MLSRGGGGGGSRNTSCYFQLQKLGFAPAVLVHLFFENLTFKISGILCLKQSFLSFI